MARKWKTVLQFGSFCQHSNSDHFVIHPTAQGLIFFLHPSTVVPHPTSDCPQIGLQFGLSLCTVSQIGLLLSLISDLGQFLPEHFLPSFVAGAFFYSSSRILILQMQMCGILVTRGPRRVFLYFQAKYPRFYSCLSEARGSILVTRGPRLKLRCGTSKLNAVMLPH